MREEDAVQNRDSNATVRQAREQYFSANGFGKDGGYDKKWVPLKFGRFTVMLYNSRARKRAVPLHDLHHIATDYSTTPKGEAQVAIWELAAGTYDMWFAFFINLPALVYGFILWPKDCSDAWKRGRRSKSLYNREFHEDLLELSTVELRKMTVGSN